mgnify:CR=1 FL=1
MLREFPDASEMYQYVFRLFSGKRKHDVTIKKISGTQFEIYGGRTTAISEKSGKGRDFRKTNETSGHFRIVSNMGKVLE